MCATFKSKSFRMGYCTVNTFADQGFIDEDRLNSQPSVREMNFARHLESREPKSAKINGQKKRGIILKPGK